MAGPIDRRSFLARGAATAAGVLAAGGAADLALGAGPVLAATNGPGRNGVSTAKPRRGGSVVFGVDAEEQGFNPSSARFDEVGVMYARTVFDPLCITTASGGWAPYLAQSVTPNAEYTSWTITLRPNIMFHDGTPLNGAALQQNLEAQYNAGLTGIVLRPVIADIKQTGPLTVTVDMKTPWLAFPFYLCGQAGGQLAYIAAPSMLNAPNGGTDNPVGTGPFKFSKWIPNDHFTAVRNPNYWRPGLPYLDQITYRPIPDANARGQALQSGTIDIMIVDTPQVIVTFRNNRSWSYIDDSGALAGEPDMNCVMLNVSKPPFNNAEVRLAAAKAISSSAYSKIVDIGVNPPINGVFVPGSPYYANPGYPTPDVAGAKKLVAKAQHETGKPVSFTLVSTNSPTAIRAAQYMAQQFQNVGMQVQSSYIEQNALINNALSGTFQALEWRQFGAVNPDLNYIWWSTTTANANGLSINMARNVDPQLEQALITGRTSPNPQTRIAAYKKVNELLAKDLPYVWNDRAVWAVVSKPSVQNWNNPTTPAGAKAYGMIGGSIWPTQIWLS
ncbi:MAG TPA: ABC transporter substrate-binding protein [Acidimicrobiales bacterium]|nr:ABC transporter substrate-binding protein [Acidimicrobiales bacterium]